MRARYWLTLVLLPLVLLGRGKGELRVETETFFPGCDHELQVIRIRGTEPGPRVLIFGGIQGDEPGSTFGADLVLNIRMIRGELMVVPRANFPAIMLNRRDMHGDMNRKFTDQESPVDPEREVVRKLKALMGEADAFLNQHDGYGFHREQGDGGLYGPRWYGQSVIVDTARFAVPGSDRVLDLEGMARRALEEVNHRVGRPDHHFCFWNHESLQRDTRFPEMKRSATYYALVRHHIPAFGLETSKNLPDLSLKARYQVMLVMALLRQLGCTFEEPDLKMEMPQLYWLELENAQKEVIRVNANTIVRFLPGDAFTFRDVCSNARGGLSVDLLQRGQINDLRRRFVHHGPGKVLVRKNQLLIGTVYLRPFLPHSIRQISLSINGFPRSIPNWGLVRLHPRDRLVVEGAQPRSRKLRVDVRGFAPRERSAGGDAGKEIRSSDLLSEYSFLGEGRIFFVHLFHEHGFAGGFQIERVGSDEAGGGS